MRALWSGCQDSAVLGITHLSVIRGICLLQGRGPHSIPDPPLLFKQAHHDQCTHFTPLTLCGSVFPLLSPPRLSSSVLSLLSPRCTSARTASLPTRIWIASECTWWHSTLSSPCYVARCARTCSTTRSTCSFTSHISTAWHPIALISSFPQWVLYSVYFACGWTQQGLLPCLSLFLYFYYFFNLYFSRYIEIGFSFVRVAFISLTVGVFLLLWSFSIELCHSISIQIYYSSWEK